MAFTRELVGAACWASYFVNGDDSGLSPDEKRMADAWLAKELYLEGERIIDVRRNDDGEGEEPWFSWHFDLYTGYDCRGGELITYVAMRP